MACRSAQLPWTQLLPAEVKDLILLLQFPASFTTAAAAAVLHKRQCQTELYLMKLVTLGIAHTHASSYRYELYSKARCCFQQHTSAVSALDMDKARYATTMQVQVNGSRPASHALYELLSDRRHAFLLHYTTLLLRVHAVHEAGAHASASMMFEQDYSNFRQIMLWAGQPSMPSAAAMHIYETILWRGMPLYKRRMPIELRVDFVNVSNDRNMPCLIGLS
jgi:hypothetical protein